MKLSQGDHIKEDDKISNIEDFQKKIITILQNLKNLDDGLYERYFSENSKFFVDTLKSKKVIEDPGLTGQFSSTYDISEYIKNEDFDMKNASYVFKFNFSLDNSVLLKQFIMDMDYLTIRAEDISLLSEGSGSSTCRSWDIEIKFNFLELDNVDLEFEPTYKICSADIAEKNENTSSGYRVIFDDSYIFNFVCMIFNLMFTVILITFIIDIVRYNYLEAQKKLKYRWLLRIKQNFHGQKALQEIMKKDTEEMKILNFWNIIMVLTSIFLLLGNLTIFIGSLGNAAKNGDIDFYVSLFIGIGCFGAWCSNLRTLSYFEGFDLVSNLFNLAAPGIFWFSVGIAPIFLAFVFSGFLMFHSDERLESLNLTFLTLLSLFAGDELMELWFGTDGLPFSQLWCYSYCFIILIAIANIFVYIVESSFETITDKEEELKKKRTEDENK